MAESPIRRFVTTFAFATALVVVPLIATGVRLAQLGEIGLELRTGSAAIRGTLFADSPVQKLRDTLRRSPEVLVLGSSRVHEFRVGMFASCANVPSCFYNASGALPTLRTGLEFFRLASAQTAPRLLILGLDIWHLDPNYELVRRHQVEPLRRDPRDELDRALAVTRSALALAATDPAVRDVLLGRAAVPDDSAGLAAILHQTGFRPDGSETYAADAWRRALALSDEDRSAAYLRLVRIGGLQFEPFERADESALDDLEALLDLAVARGTTVVAFTPPFSDAVAAAMRAQPHYAGGVADAERRLAALFAAHKVPAVVRLSMADYGCLVDEHFDGIHVSEVCGARILDALLRQPGSEVLAAYADGAALRRLIAARTSSYSLGDGP